MSTQVLNAVSGTEHLSEEQKQEVLKVKDKEVLRPTSIDLKLSCPGKLRKKNPRRKYQEFNVQVLLSLSCHTGWILNGRLVVQLLTLCLGLYCSSSTGTKAAAQATCSQTIAEYSKDLSKFISSLVNSGLIRNLAEACIESLRPIGYLI